MSHPECSTITAIEPQARNRDRVNVFIDGQWVTGVHAEVAVAAGLRVGQVIGAEQLRELTHAEEVRKARDGALRLLGYRARSRAELRGRLLQKGYDPGLVEEVLAGLERSGLINDAEFSESWVRARTGSRPMGRSRIAAELRGKGVDRELIDEALRGLEPDVELDLALAVGRRKIAQLRTADGPTARRRLGLALMRRGFPPDVCRRALDLLIQADEE